MKDSLMNIRQLILESYDLIDAHFEAAKSGIPLPDRPDLTKFGDHWGYHTGPNSHVEYNTRNRAIYYYKNGQIHRDDGPAFANSHGDKVWYQNGKKHRDSGPAVDSAAGTKHWYQHDKRHRVDGPAIEYASGAKAWYINGISQKAPKT